MTRARLVITQLFIVPALAASLSACPEKNAVPASPPIQADEASVALAVQQHLGHVKKCWKSIPERFASDTQTLRFAVKDGASTVTFADPGENGHPLGVCVRKKLGAIRFAPGTEAQIDVPVRLSARPASAASQAPTTEPPQRSPASQPARTVSKPKVAPTSQPAAKKGK